MKLQEIIKNLENYNNWRRDNDGIHDMPDTKVLGITIDAAINELKNIRKSV